MQVPEALVGKSEADLLERARNGDRDAFCDLVLGYQKRVYAVARSFCASAEEAEDLSQEVWLRVYRSLGEFRGDCGFFTWVRRIMLHTFLNSRRASAGERETLVTMRAQHEAGVSRPEVERRELNRILAQRVLQSLQILTEQQRIVLILKHVEGMTYDEIACALSCSVGTIKKALFRAIGKLRGHMNVEPYGREGLQQDE